VGVEAQPLIRTSTANSAKMPIKRFIASYPKTAINPRQLNRGFLNKILTNFRRARPNHFMVKIRG